MILQQINIELSLEFNETVFSMEICQSTCICANWDQSEIKNDKSDSYLKELLDNSYSDELETLPHIQIYITGLKSVISIQTKKIRKLRNKLREYQEEKLKKVSTKKLIWITR